MLEFNEGGIETLGGLAFGVDLIGLWPAGGQFHDLVERFGLDLLTEDRGIEADHVLNAGDASAQALDEVEQIMRR